MDGKRNSENSILRFLLRLNKDIEKFLRKSFESYSESREWSILHSEFRLLKCREVRNCRKTTCPAHYSDDYRCWLHAGTLCIDESQRGFPRKHENCFECEVYQKVAKDPLLSLYHNIDTLIYHLQGRVSKFRDLAIRDQLTGLYNRHFFNEIIEREISSLERRAEILSFALIDIDHFKDINDTLGHLTGDKILIETARLIRNSVRKADLAFRFGGDEFLVLMTNADTVLRNNVEAQIQKSVEEWNGENAGYYGLELSLSIGCSSCERGGDYFAALKEADDTMYRNKQEKKSCENAAKLSNL